MTEPEGAFALIVNPKSGSHRGLEIAGRAAARLEALGIPTRILGTAAAGDAARLASEISWNPGAVVAVGGDGTLNEVVAGLADRPGIPVGLVPVGTANVVAREIGLPLGDPEAAAETLAAGWTAALTAGRANGRPFIANVGVGYDADVVHALSRRRGEGRLGMASYLPVGFRCLVSWVAPELRIRVDDETLEGTFSAVVVSTARNYGGLLSVTPEADMRSGDLFVCARRGKGRGSVLRHLACALLRCEDSPRVAVRRRGRLVVVESPEPRAVQIDGDARGTTPLEVTTAEHRVRLIVPEAYASTAPGAARGDPTVEPRHREEPRE